MSKILFTHSYFYRFDPKQWRTKQPYPPLGTIYAASIMRSEGYRVSLFDTNLSHSPREINAIVEKDKPEYLVIYDDGFNYLTKMCLTNMREAAFEMAGIGKKNNCTVIVSSSDAADHYEKYFNRGADYVIRGEGEITLKMLIAALEEGTDTAEVDGLVYRDGGSLVRTKPRDILQDLDTLPLPAWDLIDMKKYSTIWIKAHGYFSLNIATTRGCPFKCNWCAKPIYGNRYNSRSPKNVADEIEMLIEKYNAEYFWFCDDIFGLKPGWVQIFKDEVKKRGLNFKYKIQSRVDLLLHEDTIDALAESGADTVWIGAESGSQKILDAMDKGTTVEQIYRAADLMKSRDIKVALFLQLGYLGETKEDINKTIRMVIDLLPYDIGISVSYPLPGTKFYEKVKKDLKTKSNWNDSDDLALMFRNNFSPKYYKQLHRYIHKVYRKEKGLKLLKKIIRNPKLISLNSLRTVISALLYIPQIFSASSRLRKLESTGL